MDGTDDEASWAERYNSQDPLWHVEREGELAQKNLWLRTTQKGQESYINNKG